MGQLSQADVLKAETLRFFPRLTHHTHTCSIQDLLIHTVREEAEQTMGSCHTVLQLLSGDGLIGIPQLHFTAEKRRSPRK